jgi:hypothetical protein
MNMTLQFERKYSTQGSGASCHVSFGFFSGFCGIILVELQIDPQLESAIRSKAREATFHMECDSLNRIFHMVSSSIQHEYY